MNKERRDEGQERRDEGPERGDEGPERRNEGTNDRNGERETLWPRPNSVSGTGNKDPPCVDMGGGTSDPISRCVIIGN